VLKGLNEFRKKRKKTPHSPLDPDICDVKRGKRKSKIKNFLNSSLLIAEASVAFTSFFINNFKEALLAT